MQEKITPIQYAEAVAALLLVAKQGTSGGRMAAQVLLSAYNGMAFQVDIAGLNSLDRKNHDLAMTVIRGSYDCNIEPHTLIKDGSKHFGALWDQWINLHVEERGKPECPVCEGRGFLYINPDDDNDDRRKSCQRCNGKGRVFPAT